MPKKTINKPTGNKSTPFKIFEKLLSQQTKIILGAVGERFTAVDKRFDITDQRFIGTEIRFDRKLEAMEQRFNKRLDDLMTTLDKFLKRLLDAEDESRKLLEKN